MRMGPHPAVAEVRTGVRSGLAGLAPGELVLAACSGGPDSLALAAALAHEAPRLGLKAGGVTVDHGLQPGSAQRAQAVAEVLAGLGLDPVRSVRVQVRSGAGQGGPESAARTARYQALDEVADTAGASVILLGHSRDDQAETVLLRLARGSGGRSLGGMPASRGRYRRPLLGVGRTTMRAACAALGLRPWDDPHNTDPAFTRARVRHQVLPVLEAELGPGVAEALARTAGQLRSDAEALDEIAARCAQRIRGADGSWQAGLLAAEHPAIRSRVLRAAAIGAGCPPGALTARHIESLDQLVTHWHGQRWTDLPGGVRGMRQYGKLIFTVSCRDAGHASAGPGNAEPGPGEAEVMVGRE